MSSDDSPRPPKARKARRDGWTPLRQLRFLDALAVGRNVARAAAFAGMSRESAYRLRNRGDGALFGLLWDRALAPEPAVAEVHTPRLTNGRIMRVLGAHYRRKFDDSAVLGKRGGETPDR
jgi:hypothetical protein